VHKGMENQIEELPETRRTEVAAFETYTYTCLSLVSHCVGLRVWKNKG
jgi:hypothetical protein